jgi:hypothetical protein
MGVELLCEECSVSHRLPLYKALEIRCRNLWTHGDLGRTFDSISCGMMGAGDTI